MAEEAKPECLLSTLTTDGSEEVLYSSRSSKTKLKDVKDEEPFIHEYREKKQSFDASDGIDGDDEESWFMSEEWKDEEFYTVPKTTTKCTKAKISSKHCDDEEFASVSRDTADCKEKLRSATEPMLGSETESQTDESDDEDLFPEPFLHSGTEGNQIVEGDNEDFCPGPELASEDNADEKPPKRKKKKKVRKKKPEKPPPPENPYCPTRVFVRNLHKNIRERDIWNFFQKFGTITNVRKGYKNKPFAFVTFSKKQYANNALKASPDKLICKNRQLYVEHAEDKQRKYNSIKEFQEVQEKSKHEKETVTMHWVNENLPPIEAVSNDTLSHIFSYLEMRDIIAVEQVCQRWCDVKQELKPLARLHSDSPDLNQ